jgi:hypothetical protein
VDVISLIYTALVVRALVLGSLEVAAKVSIPRTSTCDPCVMACLDRSNWLTGWASTTATITRPSFGTTLGSRNVRRSDQRSHFAQGL